MGVEYVRTCPRCQGRRWIGAGTRCTLCDGAGSVTPSTHVATPDVAAAIASQDRANAILAEMLDAQRQTCVALERLADVAEEIAGWWKAGAS